MRHGVALGQALVLEQLLDRASPGEAGVDLVPPVDRVALAELPAEKDLPPAPHGWEVDESDVEVLDLDAHLVDRAHERADLRCDRLGGPLIERLLPALDVLEERTDLRDERLGLI